MLARAAGSTAFARARPTGLAASEQVRNAVSIKSLKARMRTVENMRKITKAMKMVAASKLKHDEVRMNAAKPFVQPVIELFERLPKEDTSGPVTYFGITGDKGLCGGVNSNVAKISRNGMIEEESKGNLTKYMGVGAKGAVALKRQYGDRFTQTFEDAAKTPWTFTKASILAEAIVASKPAKLRVCSNKFISLMTYEPIAFETPTIDQAKTMNRAEFSKAMDVYSFEPSIYEVWDDLHEFYYANVIHGSYLEGAVSEQASRMSAMESASKNAGEMLDKITLLYNRARQAKITTELCEIISGASAV